MSYGLPNAFWKKVTFSIALRTELVLPGTSSQAHDLPCFPGRCPLQASTPKDWALPSDHVLLPSPLISQHRHSFLDHIHLRLNLSRSQDRKCGRDEILVSALRPIESGLCMVSSTTRSQNLPREPHPPLWAVTALVAKMALKVEQLETVALSGGDSNSRQRPLLLERWS